MLLQNPGEVCEVARGMPDSENRGHRLILFGYTKVFITEAREGRQLLIHAVIYND